MRKIKNLYTPNFKRVASQGYSGSQADLKGLVSYIEQVMKETESENVGPRVETKVEVVSSGVSGPLWMQELREKISESLGKSPVTDWDAIGIKVNETSFKQVLEKERQIDRQVFVSNQIENLRLKSKPKNKNEFHVLSKQDLAKVEASFVGQGTVVEKFSVPLQKHDFRTLSGSSWLNDEIINFYGELCMDRARCFPDRYPKIHVFNTFFYEKLSTKGYSAVRRWSKKVICIDCQFDVFEKDYIIIPVHLGMHWCCSVIDFKRKRFVYYDSLQGNNSKCLLVIFAKQLLREYLESESVDKKKVEYDTSDWVDISPKDIPAQENGYDCGVFTCMFMEYTAREEEFNFGQSDMGYMRKRIASELINLKLYVW